MCGIAGFSTPLGLDPERRRREFGPTARRMAASLLHRGPDAQRVLMVDGMALAHTRLAIVDLVSGSQPMRDAGTGVAIVYNGEVFNHRELRDELRGYPFRTHSDTEVVLAAFLRWGMGCLDRFNGQFAFAIFDPRDGALWLARDRPGILPLHYCFTPEGIAFASEAKALVAGGFVRATLDARGIKQTLQLWSPVPPRTCLQGVFTLPPASVARFANGDLSVRTWWSLDLGAAPDVITEEAAVERAGELLEDAVRLRLRADVPVAAYLSGGIDSSIVCAIAQQQLGGTLSTFSVRFEDPSFDETPWQREVAGALDTTHRSVVATSRGIGELLPEVVRAAEQVLVRAAPAPLLTLSGLVRSSGGKVVLTGEGSDEIFLGYDLYAETRVRLFWARRPESSWRPALLRRLYPYLPLVGQGDAVLRSVYGTGLDQPGAPCFSHLVRWAASSRVWRLLAPDLAASVTDEDPPATVLDALPPAFREWRPLARAQALEMLTLLAGNLLSAQGDRMLMGHSVEGRFPFLDHRLMEFAARLPVRMKLRGLTGKWVLRRLARSRIPESIVRRPKMPYRAPPARNLVGTDAPAWVREVLSPEAVAAAGLFDPDKVRRLVSKLSTSRGPASEVDAMCITAVLSGQLLLPTLLRVVDQRAADAIPVETA